jgi:beta-lactamase class D
MNNFIFRIFKLSALVLLINSCSVNKARIDNDLKSYFDKYNVDGCFTMLNNADGEITVYNMNMDTARFSPAATFKLISSLIALQTGVVTDEKMIIKSNNSDSNNIGENIHDGFKIDGTPFFHEVARRIGKKTMQSWIDSLSYGNKITEGPIDSFWFNNKLKISPDEQLGLLKKLYFDQLPFRKSVQETVRRFMLEEDNSAYKLSYKMGFAINESKEKLGWVVGWIEENRHVYFFTTLIKTDNSNIDIKEIRLNVLKDILKHYGFFEGKK